MLLVGAALVASSCGDDTTPGNPGGQVTPTFVGTITDANGETGTITVTETAGSMSSALHPEATLVCKAVIAFATRLFTLPCTHSGSTLSISGQGFVINVVFGNGAFSGTCTTPLGTGTVSILPGNGGRPVLFCGRGDDGKSFFFGANGSTIGGSTQDGVVIAGTESGNSLTLTLSLGGVMVGTATGTISGDMAAGTYTINGPARPVKVARPARPVRVARPARPVKVARPARPVRVARAALRVWD
jgi:hypothetical protein